ncbi:hypothetical protein O0L34_g18951 [Tuta absoluta]|nr:hypothetical protein O0L34_g18951 [Tuta absoluta]
MSVHSTDKNWGTTNIQSPKKQGLFNSSRHEKQQNQSVSASINNISRQNASYKQLVDEHTNSMSHAVASDKEYEPASVVLGHTAASSGAAEATSIPTNSESIDKSLADILKDGEWNGENKGKDWIYVEPKKKYRFLGKKGNAITGPNVNFKANDVKVPLFIYNVSKEVTVCDIKQYIASKTNAQVLIEKIDMKVQKSYDAYKVFVPSRNLDLFLQENFWPEGITYCRFIHFRQNKTGKR